MHLYQVLSKIVRRKRNYVPFGFGNQNERGTTRMCISTQKTRPQSELPFKNRELRTCIREYST